MGIEILGSYVGISLYIDDYDFCPLKIENLHDYDLLRLE